MNPVQYVVVRYIADRVRYEPLNVGIVLWEGEHSHVRIDQEAIDRVLRDYPNLHKDALTDLRAILEEETRNRTIEEFIDAQQGLPYELTDVRDASPNKEAPEILEILTERLVRPQKKKGGGRMSPVTRVAHQFKPYIEQSIMTKDYQFVKSNSGRPRKLSFFANHGANFGIDVVSLALMDADRIRDRAHARAFEYSDIKAVNDVSILTYCPIYQYEQVREATEDARASFESVDVEFITNIDDVTREVELRLGHPQMIAARQQTLRHQPQQAKFIEQS